MIDFATIEKEMYEKKCKEAWEEINKILILEDEKIFKSRDKNKYLVFGNKEKKINSLFGEVKYKGRKYRDRDENKYKVLLNEKFEIQRKSTGRGYTSATISIISSLKEKGVSLRKITKILELHNIKITYQNVKLILDSID